MKEISTFIILMHRKVFHSFIHSIYWWKRKAEGICFEQSHGEAVNILDRMLSGSHFSVIIKPHTLCLLPKFSASLGDRRSH